MAIFLAVLKSVLATRWFYLIESIVNISLLAFSVLMPIFALPEVAFSGGEPSFKFGLVEFIHFILVGSVLIYGFYSNPIIVGVDRIPNKKTIKTFGRDRQSFALTDPALGVRNHKK